MKKSAIIFAFLLILFGGCRPTIKYHTIEGYTQGGSFHIIYSEIGDSSKTIPYQEEYILDKVEHTLWQIDNSLSGYNHNSTLSKINRNERVFLDSLFMDLFSISNSISLETEGYFDISGAPLFDIWGFGFSNKQVVSEGQLDSILNFVGMDKVRISDSTLIKDDPRVQLNFNAIAQGYSCDVVAHLLESMGVTDYLVEIGMEIMCKGNNSKGLNWKIGIDVPRDGNNKAGESIQEVLSITNAGIVTSGNYRKYYIKDGQKYSHTINPKTGYPVQHNLLSATIIAPNATIADAYATYCMVIGLEESIAFLKERKDLEGYLVYGDQNDMKVYYTDGIKKLIQ